MKYGRIGKKMSVASLHLAIEKRDKIGIKTLLQNNVDMNCVHGEETALTNAILFEAYDIADMILEHDKCSVNACNRKGHSPLYLASLTGHLSLIKLILERGGDVNKVTPQGKTPLFFAVRSNNVENAACLIQFGASTNLADTKGITPLFDACSYLSVNVVKLLIDNGSDVNSRTHDRKTPLMATVLAVDLESVCNSRMIEIISLLLEHGADPDTQDNNLYSALHFAVEGKKAYVAYFLIERGCKLNILNNWQLSPFDIAISVSTQLFYLAIVIILHGFPLPKLNKELLSGVLYKSKYEEYDELKERSRTALLSILLSETIDKCKVRSFCAKAVIHFTNDPDVDQRCLKILKHYSEIKAPEISLIRICWQSIRRFLTKNLFYSVKQLKFSVALEKMLLFGIDTRFFEVYNLFSSIERGLNSDLQRFINDDETNKDYELCDTTPLMAAAASNNIGAVSYFLSIQANCHCQNGDGDCALHVAAQHGYTEIVQLLSNCNICKIKKNNKGNMAFHEALVHGHVGCALSLLDSCSNSEIDRPDLNGIPPLHYAVVNNSFDLTSGLLIKGASVDALDTNGNTALHVAVTKGTIYLKENKCDVQQLFYDKTPIGAYLPSIPTCDESEISNRSGFQFDSHKQILDVLVGAGCDVNIRNSDGKKALKLSRKFGFSDTFSLLSLSN